MAVKCPHHRVTPTEQSRGNSRIKDMDMIKIEYLIGCNGADKFGTCASCSKDSHEDRKMIRVRIGSKAAGYYQGTAFCLCNECRELMCKTI